MSTTATLTAISTPTTVMIESLSAISSTSSAGRVVRFDSECILIPESQHRSKRPKMGTKTYSLPLWKRKPHLPSSSSDTDLVEDVPTSPEETHVVFKVPLPSFMTKSRSPSRGTSERTPKPLSPCLVHRTPSSSPPDSSISHPHPRHQPVRRPSLPLPDDRKPLITVPLRACCPDCVPITEECLKEGALWQEKFTRGARRRRSASLDATDSISSNISSGFAAIACHRTNTTDNPTPAVVSSRFPSAFSITVDEVDKRRKSIDFSEDEAKRVWKSIHDISPSSSTSNGKENLNPGSASPNHDFPPKASPIEEEDEDQLFPLPSPRRTPNTSPAPSPTNSPAPSPNASTSCLGASASASRDSLAGGTSSGSDEGVIARSIKRKGRYLTPPDLSPNPAQYVPSSLRDSTGIDADASPEDSAPLLPSALPASPIAQPQPQSIPKPLAAISIPANHLYTSPYLHASSSVSTPSVLAMPTPTSPSQHTRAASTPSPIPTPSLPQSTTPSSHPPSSYSFPSTTLPPTTLPFLRSSPSSPSLSLSFTRKSRSVSITRGRSNSTASTTSTSPASPTSPKKRRPSFSIPRPATFLKAGADVLKGVTSLSSVPV